MQPKSQRYLSLYEINTRVYLHSLKLRQDGQVHRGLDDIPDAEIEDLRRLGFDWVYLLGVWQTGSASRQVSRNLPELRPEFQALLDDLREEDICGSCFALAGYRAHTNLGGNAALRRFRKRLHRCGLRLMLDFVHNHTALDHPWVRQHPEYYVHGTPAQMGEQPHDYARLETPGGASIFAHGRDPNFPGWTDTFQLNYGNPQLQQAMIRELMKVAAMCDGVRCDMAMLALPEVFARTWGIQAEPFWSRAIREVRLRYPYFTFMAEAYWDLEWALQQQGFDFTYDKRLYDRLLGLEARPVREHFWAAPDYQDKSVRFLENHDEPRAAATFPLETHRAAALLAFLCPGLRFFHQGQLQGWQKKIPMQLCRAPEQPTSRQIETFYRRLLELLRQDLPRNGEWQLLECTPAWEGNPTWDSTIAFAWRGQDNKLWLVVVNYAPHQSQCYLRLPFPKFAGVPLHLNDLLSTESYSREGDDLLARGLYLDLPPWGHHVLEVIKGG
jgi:hypothetical protein